jgi:hypothetical protein
MTPFNSTLRGLSVCSLIAAAATTLSTRAQDSDSSSGWMRHFRIGGSFMLNVSTEFKTSGTFQVNRPPPSAAGGIRYDDGFVGVDATGNAIPPGGAGPVTTFWGYNDASQYDPAANRLTFHGSQSFDASGFDKVTDIPLGFDMVYAGTFARWEHVAIGGEFGFGFNMFDSRDHRSTPATLTRIVDQYDTSGIPSANFPAAPYSGPESGQPTTPGGSAPVLPATPVSSATEVVPGTVGGTRSLEGILYNFRLGPQVRWEFYPRWTLNGSGGAALGIFDAEYHFNEIISATAGSSVSNSGKFGSTDLKLGGYASAVVMYDTLNEWEPYIGVHFMSLPDGKISQGGRLATMRLGSAIYITAGINWSF